MVHKKFKECKHEYYFNKYCGADVCSKCGEHKGLAHCFCGWKIGSADPEAKYREEW
jgi:hypothetical protein